MAKSILALQAMESEGAMIDEGAPIKGSFTSWEYCNGWGSSLYSFRTCY
jgi:hypothetical protein